MSYEIDEHMRRFFNNNRKRFIDELPPDIVEEFQGLSHGERQGVRCIREQRGPFASNSNLLDCIMRVEDFAQKLLPFLEKNEHNGLANELRGELTRIMPSRRVAHPVAQGAAAAPPGMHELPPNIPAGDLGPAQRDPSQAQIPPAPRSEQSSSFYIRSSVIDAALPDDPDEGQISNLKLSPEAAMSQVKRNVEGDPGPAQRDPSQAQIPPAPRSEQSSSFYIRSSVIDAALPDDPDEGQISNLKLSPETAMSQVKRNVEGVAVQETGGGGATPKLTAPLQCDEDVKAVDVDKEDEVKKEQRGKDCKEFYSARPSIDLSRNMLEQTNVKTVVSTKEADGATMKDADNGEDGAIGMESETKLKQVGFSELNREVTHYHPANPYETSDENVVKDHATDTPDGSVEEDSSFESPLISSETDDGTETLNRSVEENSSSEPPLGPLDPPVRTGDGTDTPNGIVDNTYPADGESDAPSPPHDTEMSLQGSDVATSSSQSEADTQEVALQNSMSNTSSEWTRLFKRSVDGPIKAFFLLRDVFQW